MITFKSQKEKNCVVTRPDHDPQNHSFDGSDPVGPNGRARSSGSGHLEGPKHHRSKSASRSASSYNLNHSASGLLDNSGRHNGFGRSTQNFVVTQENTYALEIGPSRSEGGRGLNVQTHRRTYSRQASRNSNGETSSSIVSHSINGGGHSPPLLSHMNSEPSLIQHPGTSKSRDNRKSKKSKKKGKQPFKKFSRYKFSTHRKLNREWGKYFV